MSWEVLSVMVAEPLYVAPVIVVVTVLVFAFGFTANTPQPSREVFDALNTHHKNQRIHDLPLKRKKPNTHKITSTKTEPKSEPNGHVNDGSVKTADKKTPKKASVESKSSAKTATNANTEKKSVSKRLKNKKNDGLAEEFEDKDSGEWVELISKKERKNRKQKEEKLLVESNDSPKNKTNKKEKNVEKSPKTESKKSEKVIAATVKSDSKAKEESNKVLEVKSEEKVNKNEVKEVIEVNGEEQVSEDLDIYELAKEQRVGKKWQKRNQKRGSESDSTPKSEPLAGNEVKTNLDVSDKLTASIVANYETNDHNKSDSINTTNNKKKNKKKQTVAQVNNESNDNIVSVAVNESENVSSIDIPNEIKPSEEEEFKSVGKKRRARRE
ncbi:unnamed protein product [Medioppia subpectinata]|uniref:Uncharacterized protein n=1 Tax=Medioppia subpectinata TaxID=1979941 RepID=A0A7R9PY55_9ACAR|nr:unnamed protein product [Medioppia subpectinata]CAG2105528.1 unnamed protein product [Medioppia subpectinata]